MMLREWFKKMPGLPRSAAPDKARMPEGLFQKCPGCSRILCVQDLEENAYVCPECGHYWRIGARSRIHMVLDKGSFNEWDPHLETADPLQFPGYQQKLEKIRAASGLDEAVLTGSGTVRKLPVAVGVMSADFMMGSMGSVVGEKLTRMIERATAERLPVILFCCSGGARMQEGIFSLMQMAKTAQAIRRHGEAGLLYLSLIHIFPFR